MKFTEEEAAWLRAALDGKTVQYRKKTDAKFCSYEWTTAQDFYVDVIKLTHPDYEVRIKPDVIVVNGIEVPAPEKVAPDHGETYYLAAPEREDGTWGSWWSGNEDDETFLRFGILHKTRDAAAAHGKAMRAHKPG